MRREPGEGLRGHLHEIEERIEETESGATVDCSLYVGAGLGLTFVALFPMALSYLGLPSHALVTPPWLLAGAVVSFALGFILMMRGRAKTRRDRRRAENRKKGLNAERRIGQAIDYAVAAPGCAVAHDVTEIAKYGNIDHLVLTPARLWVVETKSGRVPRNEFRKALGQIAANVEATREWVRREWVQKDTDVQGCLVLASGEVTDHDEKGYKAKGETIPVKDRDSLWRTLREEARAGPAADNADVQRVWALGKMKK